ncbi:cyclin-L2-like, partial [Tropilaelaps mercedesae]
MAETASDSCRSSDLETSASSDTESDASLAWRTRTVGSIRLTNGFWIYSSEQLASTPSLQDGLDVELEADLRFIGCELIQQASGLLRLSHAVVTTAQMLFHRFYVRQSFFVHSFKIAAMACVMLASKIEYAPRHLFDVIGAFRLVDQLRKDSTARPPQQDLGYVTLKHLVVQTEWRVLRDLGYCVRVQHSHKLITPIVELVLQRADRKIIQLAWNYMNDCHRSDIVLRYPPETIVCACIQIASRLRRTPMPDAPHWYTAFGVSDADMDAAVRRILGLYVRPKVNVAKVEWLVHLLRSQIMKSKGVDFAHSPLNRRAGSNQLGQPFSQFELFESL